MRKKNKIIFVSMCADGLHHGHINIIEKASKLGKVWIGLMTDKGIVSYKKKKPLMKFIDRKKVLSHINLVFKIVPINSLNFSLIAKKYKVDCWVHGDDWKNGPQARSRLDLKNTMKKWKGKVIDVKYTKNISSSKLFRFLD
tara:strand:+ start:911 stop:1333 length:423 start_codon:yes stop_codon:yes gene_type:complete